jgi:hypothetical protein
VLAQVPSVALVVLAVSEIFHLQALLQLAEAVEAAVEPELEPLVDMGLLVLLVHLRTEPADQLVEEFQLKALL